MACDREVSDLMLPLWEEVLWPFLDAWDSVLLRTTSKQWNVLGRYGPYGELFFFLLEKEAMVLREPTFAPDREAFNSYIGDGFLVPELKDEREASKDEQAETARAQTTWVMARCLSSGYIELAMQFSSSNKTGRWQR